MQLPNHGANPQNVYHQLGLNMPEEVYDFSENVNSAGPPLFVEARWRTFYPLIQRYPDPDGEPFLSKVAAFHGVQKDSVLLGNGASELFSVLVRRYANKRVIIVHPTFSEYERTLRAVGAEIVPVIVEDIVHYTLPMEHLKREMANADALYICTPNNPTGVLPKKEELLELIAHGTKVNCELVFDEAFIDWVDETCSLIQYVTENPHLIIVRSMTKMYAIPGLRLGYLVASPIVVADLKSILPHWNLNAFALVIGTGCLDEHEYCEQAIAYAKNQRESLQSYLQEHGCQVTNSVTNFVCFTLPKNQQADTFFTYCLSKGVVLRHTKNFLGLNGEWFRIGIKDIAAMTYLQNCLQAWFNFFQQKSPSSIGGEMNKVLSLLSADVQSSVPDARLSVQKNPLK
ncbi:histidinol-phosphate transaminase [Lysinibacillus sp. Ag94]|uniref:pyridoxal phosphate-dependent aminotransferase n=1 Tax=Lysinibacillus sp. Ag94 TaxID=2936682 RepID=UPI00200E752A|nr:threonine-phosphate decarboxylase [Lysinibacillus sp. Ag94]UPW85053.1 pyridoxal phosphate-dependent class II aminotransferase [Lysinibacillus sp. Ag94]